VGNAAYGGIIMLMMHNSPGAGIIFNCVAYNRVVNKYMKTIDIRRSYVLFSIQPALPDFVKTGFTAAYIFINNSSTDG